MNAFFVALNAVFPFLIYLGLGYSIRLTGYADEAFFRRLNRIIFVFFFSVLTFTNIYNIDRDVRLNPRVALFGAGGVILSIVVLMIVVSCFTPAPSKEQVDAITFPPEYRMQISDSWNIWDIIGTLGVITLCACFYAYFW